MKLTVKYFAAFREAAGVGTESLDSNAATPAELFKECQHRHDALQTYSASLVAVNDEMADWDSPLTEGDTVLFFPPVAGG